MPHQCVRCGEIYHPGSRAIIDGCSKCGAHFFFYIREEQLEKLKQIQVEIPDAEKDQIETEVREMAGIKDEDVPVILDIESVRVKSPGKYEIDLVSLFNKKKPVIYKLEEGKYIIDLAYTLQKGKIDDFEKEKI